MPTSRPSHPSVLILGAGPAGLTAAHELSSSGWPVTVFEAAGSVGGLSRTVNHQGFLFDIGGHRFFTRVALIERLWRDILGGDLLSRRRQSRIYYKRRFFHYPLDPWDALSGLGFTEAARCLASYLARLVAPLRPDDDLESWLVNRFGRRLYEIFFKTYTEKVWGLPCSRLHSDWAAQRIAGLSLAGLIRDTLSPFRRSGRAPSPKTLIREFLYPRKGPGMLWEAVARRIEGLGSRVLLRTPVQRLLWDARGVHTVVAGGKSFPASHVLSSLALGDLIRMLEPPPPPAVIEDANSLSYRDFITVALIIRRSELFPDQWIYVHDPDVRVGRIQNYKNWSPEMVPDPACTCLGLEFFCSAGDPLWALSDLELLALARREVAALGLCGADEILDGAVVRVLKAYPVYAPGYAEVLARIRALLQTLPNLQTVGRNGMHRYNNQDHSMLTAILAARNILGAAFNVWTVNLEASHHESASPLPWEEIEAMCSTQPAVPRTLSAVASD